MALSSSTILEVRSTGADTNSGGFVTGASGTDWSQQNAAQYSVTDGVTAGTTTITSVLGSFGTDVVGNLIYVQGGTGAVVAGWYQITARTNSTTITVDRATGLTAGTGVTLKIGGCFATIAPALALMTVTGMAMYVKATATYTISTALTWPVGANYSQDSNRMLGYTATRGDRGRAKIQATAAVAGIVCAPGGCVIENFELDGNSIGTAGFSFGNGQSNNASNIWAHHWTAEGITTTGGGQSSFAFCEVNNCAGTNGAFVVPSGTLVFGCYSHDNTKSGFYGAVAAIIFCVSANNTGASSDGFNLGYNCAVTNCVAYNNGRTGINYSGQMLGLCLNNTLVNNAAYGINTNTSVTNTVAATINFNAFFGNVSGARNRLTAGANDVILTGVPFTNAAGADYSLNNTAGQGAALRNAGTPGVSTFGTGYADIGALRHQDPTSSGGNIFPVFD